MIPEKGQRTGVVRVVIHNSDQLISHLCLRGKSEESERERIKKNQSKDARQQRTRGGLLCPHILSHAETKQKGWQRKTSDLTIEGFLAKENEKRAIEPNSIQKFLNFF